MLKILTYNIHKGFNRYNRDFVLHEIREQLETVAVDVVFLQEIQGEHQRHEANIENWPEANQFEFLADELWPHYAYGKNAIYTGGHHGNAILSKYPFEQWDNINVSRFSWASRSFLHGVIHIPEAEEKLHLICVHLDLIGFERRRQYKILEEYIRTSIPNGEPMILAGDFNDWSSRTGMHLEAGLNMQEAFRSCRASYARTFPSHWPILRMDRIYYRGLRLLDCECLSGHPWSSMSDHLPLYANLSEL